MYKRIVIKVGTKVLLQDSGHVDTDVLKHLVAQIADLKQQGIEVVLVTSGAVGFGRSVLPASQGKETIADKQVFAATGQIKLMHTYAALFVQHGYQCAQVLVTKEDFRDAEHYHNMRRCFENLLRDNIVPIVNENDVVAIKELVFTDNDELAGLVASQLNVDAVIILTSTNGVLDGNPKDETTKTIPTITLATIDDFKKHITQEKTGVGRGGMATKFAIAQKLMSSGIAVHIVRGKQEGVLQSVVQGDEVGTTFVPERKTTGTKRRLAYANGLAVGAVVINTCASELFAKKDQALSLLPVGVIRVVGSFKKGDVIEIQNEQGDRIGFGVSGYDAADVDAIKGQKDKKAVVHYDYLFVE